MTDTDLLFPITLTLQAALTSVVLFAVIGVPLALYTARSKTRLSRAVLFIATLPPHFPARRPGLSASPSSRNQRSRGGAPP